jgi:hypothetical protein
MSKNDLLDRAAEKCPHNPRDRFNKCRSHSHHDNTLFDPRELARYHDIMLHELQMVQCDVKKWMTLLESGYDELLKVILISL